MHVDCQFLRKHPTEIDRGETVMCKTESSNAVDSLLTHVVALRLCAIMRNLQFNSDIGLGRSCFPVACTPHLHLVTSFYGGDRSRSKDPGLCPLLTSDKGFDQLMLKCACLSANRLPSLSSLFHKGHHCVLQHFIRHLFLHPNHDERHDDNLRRTAWSRMDEMGCPTLPGK